MALTGRVALTLRCDAKAVRECEDRLRPDQAAGSYSTPLPQGFDQWSGFCRNVQVVRTKK